MNTELEGTHIATVALRGRVPCKVIGAVRKGDILVASTTAGHAVRASHAHFVGQGVVGIALEDKADSAPGFVEILV
jgi:hypothetical protein